MRRTNLSVLSVALLAGIAAFISTPREAQAAFCPQYYRPVCAVNPAGMRQTYTNAVCARVAHARILHRGKCVGPICSFIFLPVCALNPFTHLPQTYPNFCIAETSDATFLHNGKCR
jgi:hypothetical protein